MAGLGQVGASGGWASTPMGPAATAGAGSATAVGGGPASSNGDPFGALGGPMGMRQATAEAASSDPFAASGIAPYTGELTTDIIGQWCLA